MTVGTAKVRADRLPPALLKLAGVVMLGALMMQLDTTMTNIATNTLLVEFDVPLSTLQWISTGYLLAMAMVIPAAGWALDRFGARAVWMSATALFLVGSLLCGLAWSIESLIAFRVVQGLGGGLILPLAQSIVAQAAGPERLGRMTAAIGVPALLGPVLGPVLGGLIVTDLHWRWIFFVNLPICAIGLVLSRNIIPSSRADSGGRLDLTGLALLSVGSVALVYGCVEAGRYGTFAEQRVVVVIGVGLAVLAGFTWHVLRIPQPIIDLRLLRSRAFAASSVTMFLSTVVLFGAMGLLPLYYQQVRGEDALRTGLLLIPLGAGMGLSLIICGRLSDRIAPRGIAVAGLATATAGLLAYTRLDAHTSLLAIGVAQVLSGAGVGSILIPVTTAAIRGLAYDAIPRASTAVRIFQQLGGSFGGALLLIVLQRAIVDRAHGAPPDPGAVAGAFGHTFWWPVGFAVFTLIPVLLLPTSTRVDRWR
jgi:EmrB/QacA subfamily drug resistance transporter